MAIDGAKEKNPLVVRTIVPLADDKIDAIFCRLATSAENLAERMERRVNVYLMLGITVGGIGLGVWAYVNHGFQPTEGMSLTQVYLAHFARITILLFIEVLAGFFLHQYRIGVEDFKYFLQFKRQADTNRLVHSLVSAQGTDDLRTKLLDASLHRWPVGEQTEARRVRGPIVAWIARGVARTQNFTIR